jgi:L-seryl-tRNA(Ser) seleniumtransferase
VNRELPSISQLVAHPSTERLLIRFNREGVMQGYRDILSELERALRQGHAVDPADLEVDAILVRLESRLAATDDAWLEQVVNATGDVLHNGLGRALLPTVATDAMVRAATAPVTIDYDLSQGEHGRREQSVEHLLMDLTKADAATVVNNNTAAVLLAVNALAIGKEVVVSHVDLIRGGPTLRLRELLVASGSRLRAVGTPDRVSAADYDAAITDRTGLLLTAHTGHDDGIELAELVSVGHRRNIPVMEDLDGGTFVDLSRYGLPKEPVVAERVACGVDIVTFSGDTLVGGPQAGLIVGRAASLALLGESALHRALQCSKFTIAALEATLRLYRESACVAQEVPTLRAMTRSLSDIENTANRALPALASALGTGFRLSLVDGMSHTGAGTPHASAIPTKMIVIQHDYMGGHRIAGRFRQASPPIVGRVEDDLFILDARTIFDPLDMVPNWTDELNLA